MFLGSRALPVRKADNFAAVSERLSRQCGILNFSQPYRPPVSVTEIALLTVTSSLITAIGTWIAYPSVRSVHSTCNTTRVARSTLHTAQWPLVSPSQLPGKLPPVTDEIPESQIGDVTPLSVSWIASLRTRCDVFLAREKQYRQLTPGCSTYSSRLRSLPAIFTESVYI
jgi:hypothetical protein